MDRFDSFFVMKRKALDATSKSAIFPCHEDCRKKGGWMPIALIEKVFHYLNYYLTPSIYHLIRMLRLD